MFKAFLSTVTPPARRILSAYTRLLHDPVTGAPVGIENPNANGADGIFVPIDLTAAQIANPDPLMIADLNSTFRLNVAPYTRYQSNGTTLVSLGGDDPYQMFSTQQTIPPGTDAQVVQAGAYYDVYSPFTVQNTGGVTVLGSLYVTSRPA